MNSPDWLKAATPSLEINHTMITTIPELVGKIYEAAPINERCQILNYLVRPLGALALVGVCNGLFTKTWFRSGWQEFRIQPEDAKAVQGIDVISLVPYVQQSSVETINGLAALLTTSPVVTYSAAAAILVTTLARQTQSRRSSRDKISVPSDQGPLAT